VHNLDDTIVAIASAPGGAARGIVRLSGPDVSKCLIKYFFPEGGRGLSSIIAPSAIAGAFHLPGYASPLPCEVLLWPDKRSYTGQPVAEIHTLGCPPLLEAAVRALAAAGARPAEPGEFTLRAFLAGRIDLTQAEAVLGAIDAAGPSELRVALEQLAGGLAAPLHHLRDTLLDLLAHLEAGFDFAEEDLAFISKEELLRLLGDAAAAVARLARQMASRGQSGEMPRVVLVGRPNAGKSSLFNALAGSAGALVSAHPGTTRDYLTAELHLGGVCCQLIDTAGMATTIARVESDVQQAAMAAALEQGRQAQVIILCLDATMPLDDWHREQALTVSARECILVWTKVDLAFRPVARPPSAVSIVAQPPLAAPSLSTQSRPTDPWSDIQPNPLSCAIATSSITGEGIQKLREAIRSAVLRAADARCDVVAGTAIRCRHSLSAAGACLKRAEQLSRDDQGEELVAAELRVALEELGKVVGAVYTDDVLDCIFSRFCIGK
jgi:tRNA modification GTPase